MNNLHEYSYRQLNTENTCRLPHKVIIEMKDTDHNAYSLQLPGQSVF